jgi:hypothetical protein
MHGSESGNRRTHNLRFASKQVALCAYAVNASSAEIQLAALTAMNEVERWFAALLLLSVPLAVFNAHSVCVAAGRLLGQWICEGRRSASWSRSYRLQFTQRSIDTSVVFLLNAERISNTDRRATRQTVNMGSEHEDPGAEEPIRTHRCRGATRHRLKPILESGEVEKKRGGCSHRR